MPWLILTALLAVGALVFGILWLTFTLIGRSIAKEAAALRGVVRDSGPVKVITRYRQFRSAREYRGAAYKSAPGRVVLTDAELLILQRPQRYGKFRREDLHRFTVGVVDAVYLQLRSEDPPEASGTIEYRMRLEAPQRWVAALVEAGARPTPGGDPGTATSSAGPGKASSGSR